MKSLCDYVELLRMIEEKGRQLFGRHYSIHPIDRPSVEKMIAISRRTAGGPGRKVLCLERGECCAVRWDAVKRP